MTAPDGIHGLADTAGDGQSRTEPHVGRTGAPATTEHSTVISGTGAISPEASSKPGALALFDWIAFCGLLLLLIWAAWSGQRTIGALTALLVVAAGVARLWSRYALWRVSYERLLSERRAFPGEEIVLTARLVNQKPLPVAWLQVEDGIPANLRPESPEWRPAQGQSGGVLVHVASLLWYRRIVWRHKLICRRRGSYTIGPVRISGGDPFGFFARDSALAIADQIVVYPRVLPIEHLDLLARHPLGEMRANQRIFEDPSRTIGIREFRSGDSLKRINWKASARRQQLQVRVYEPTTTVQTMLALGLEGYEGPDGAERFELAITTIASLANHGFALRQATGLLINAGSRSEGGYLCLRPAAAREDLTRILETLACVEPVPAKSLAETLVEAGATLPWGATIAVLPGLVDDALLAALDQLRRHGRRVCLCSTGTDPSIHLDLGIPVQHVVLGKG